MLLSGDTAGGGGRGELFREASLGPWMMGTGKNAPNSTFGDLTDTYESVQLDQIGPAGIRRVFDNWEWVESGGGECLRAGLDGWRGRLERSSVEESGELFNT